MIITFILLQEKSTLMKKRAEVIIHGRVQKAGFRDFIDEIAFDLALNGYVKNLDDGTVQVVCEGTEGSIRELLEKVNITQYPIRVTNIDVVYTKATGEYGTFEIVRDEDLTTATYERMDAAVRYMREMNSNLGQKIDRVGDGVDSVGSKVEVVSGKIDGLGDKIDVVGEKIDQNRTEIASEVRLNRDDFRSHLDERISTIEHELAQIKAKIMF